MIKIMVGIQKGGVGKSTTTAIVSEILAASGFNVLVIDLDSQGNATQMLTQKNIYEFSGKTVLEAMKELNPNPYIYRIKDNLSIIPAEDMLSTFSRWVYVNSRTPTPAEVLKHTIDNLEEQYDFILMDCPPNVGDLVVNAIHTADHILIPVQLEPFSMDALDRFVDLIVGAQEEGYTDAKILGIVYTMIDSRNSTQKAIGEAIRNKYGEKVFSSSVRLRAKIKDFTLLGVQMEKKLDVEALEDYISVTEEVVNRVKKQNK